MKEAGGNTPPARILVIDDEEIIHVSVRRILQRYGHQVDAVLSAKEGLNRLREESYDLVITDLMMPEMNGIQLLKQLSRDRLTLPVLMITGYPTISTAVQALRLGAMDYLAKPFTRQELMGPVNRALRREGMPHESSSVNGEPAFSSEGLDAPDVDLAPGDTYYLREHSWATFRQDGTMEVGIEQSFLGAVGEVVCIDPPSDGDLLEQGYVSTRITTRSGEVHSVFTPLSGQVVQVNHKIVENPAGLAADTWVVRLLPTKLEHELTLLKKR
jgi:CheY-like chemotaxis protein